MSQTCPMQQKKREEINIQRSDGRVHPAQIVRIDATTGCMDVEWHEGNDTKGKSISFNEVRAFNPNFPLPQKEIKSRLHPPSPTPMNRSPSPTALKMPPPSFLPKGGLTARSTAHRETIVTGRIKITPKEPKDAETGTRTKIAAPIPFIDRRRSLVRTPTQPRQNAVKRQSVVRTSECLREVKKLETNREERRERMEAIKEERRQLRNQDPGNPNWEVAAMIKEFKANHVFRPLVMEDEVRTFQINVCVRKRPLNKKELARFDIDVMSVVTKNTLYVHEPKQKLDLTKYIDNQGFRFDYVFNEDCTNEMVYRFTARPLVKTLFEGGFATCFAYGQTGSGKTHTMGGEFTHGASQDSSNGIYALVARDIFTGLSRMEMIEKNLVLNCSFFEIYSGKVFDLLNNRERLQIMEDSKAEVNIVGLTEKQVDDEEQVLKAIDDGNTCRTSGQTSANAHSSRSHAVFQLVLRYKEDAKFYGKFSLIDLAGNERGADTMSSNRHTRMEGAEINKSLLALKECIRALGRKNVQHLPFRGAKLTQVLRDSFIGQNSKTCMIAMISPGMSCCEHTINTLRYANRVKELTVNDEEGLARPDDEIESFAGNGEQVLRIAGDGAMVNLVNDVPLKGTSAVPPKGDESEGKDKLQTSDELPSHNGVTRQQLAASEMSYDSDFAALDKLGEIEDDFLCNETAPNFDEEMNSFHEKLSKLNSMEEEVQESHLSLLRCIPNVVKQLQQLYNGTSDTDYDPDVYAKRTKELLIELRKATNDLESKIDSFGEDLKQEEEMSKHLKDKAANKQIG